MTKYILNNTLEEDLRSNFCKLIEFIYIDKEPRILINKPYLIRKIDIKSLEKKRNTINKSEPTIKMSIS